MSWVSEHPCNLSTWCIVQVIHSPGPLITSMILTLLSRGIKVNQISHPLISRSLISTFIGQSKSSRSLDPQLVAVVGTSKPSIGCSNIFNTLSDLISMGIKTHKMWPPHHGGDWSSSHQIRGHDFVSWEKKLPGFEVHEKVVHLMKEG